MPVSLLIRNAEVEGRRVDVQIADGRIASVGARLAPRRGDEVVDARGGALLPGLHDHHLHLLALAAAADSVPCGPPHVRDASALARALADAAARESQGWLRGVGYHESVAGSLDRDALDRLIPHRPARIQHRSGALWIVNSEGARRLRLDDERSAGVERDERGRPTGRLWRWDAELRRRIGGTMPSLAGTGRHLAAVGITGVTDATARLESGAITALRNAAVRGELPQRIVVLGADGTNPPLHLGPWKIVLRDGSLPALDAVAAEIDRMHRAARPVAVHAVTREALLLALAAFDDAVSLEGDRIEHAAVAPEEALPRLARARLRVVTQPVFVADRGDEYAREFDAFDLRDLYRYRTLLAAGVRVAPSSDAPYGDPDPWRTIRAAAARTTGSGVVLGPAERVAPADVLAGYLSPADDPGGPPRRVRAGAPADLCLLHVPLRDALAAPDAQLVRAVARGGMWVRPPDACV